MAKPWDDSLKKLVHADPQAFVSWFVPGADSDESMGLRQITQQCF